MSCLSSLRALDSASASVLPQPTSVEGVTNSFMDESLKSVKCIHRRYFSWTSESAHPISADDDL